MTGLETGIQRLVDEFIAAGRPNARLQPLNERRQGYEASVCWRDPPPRFAPRSWSWKAFACDVTCLTPRGLGPRLSTSMEAALWPEAL